MSGALLEMADEALAIGGLILILYGYPLYGLPMMAVGLAWMYSKGELGFLG